MDNGTPAEAPGAPQTLREEHDALARRLAARRSIDHVRRGAYTAFAAAITAGISAKLAWDRWGPRHPRAFRAPPILFHLAVALASALVAYAVLSFVRARRHMRAEDRDFERLRSLRDALGLDP